METLSMQISKVTSFVLSRINRVIHLRKLLTKIRKFFNLSDIAHWAQLSNHDPNWENRSRLVSSLMVSQETVLEFGAGRKYLKNLLPSGCTYLHSDCVDRGDGTIICDLNTRPLPPFPEADCVVLCGTIEYVNDPASFLSQVSLICKRLVVSYVCAIDPTLRNEISVRRSLGWVNDYSQTQFIEMVERSGFRLTQILNYQDSQKIFEFRSQQNKSKESKCD